MAGNATDDSWRAIEPFFYGRWDAGAQAHQAAQDGHRNEEAAAAFGAEGAFDPDATRAALAAFNAPVLLAGEVDLNTIRASWPNSIRAKGGATWPRPQQPHEGGAPTRRRGNRSGPAATGRPGRVRRDRLRRDVGARAEPAPGREPCPAHRALRLQGGLWFAAMEHALAQAEHTWREVADSPGLEDLQALRQESSGR